MTELTTQENFMDLCYPYIHLHSALSVQDLYYQLDKIIEDILPQAAYLIYIQDGVTGKFFLNHHKGIDGDRNLVSQEVNPGDIPSFEESRVWSSPTNIASQEVWASIPLKFHGETFGNVLFCMSIPENGRLWSNLQNIFAHLSPAIIKLQLCEAADKAAAESNAKLAALTETGRLLSNLDLDFLLPKIMELALIIVSGEVGSLMLLKDKGLVSEVEWGLSDEMVRKIKSKTGKALVEMVIEEHEPVLIEDMSSDPQFDFPLHQDVNINSFLCIPLVSEKRPVGVLNIVNTPTNAGGHGAFSKSDLDILTTISGFAATAIENAIFYKESLEAERLREQMQIAGHIQQELLTKELPEVKGIEMYGRSIACEGAGGDYFDFLRIGDSQVGIAIGDVSGHGIGAALLMATARACLRTLSAIILNPGDVLYRINNFLETDMNSEHFMSMFLGVLDTKERSIVYSNAGHCPALIYRRQSDDFDELPTTGLVLGLFSEQPFPNEVYEGIEQGDIIALCTDGILEAKNQEDEMFGKERLKEVIQSNRDKSAMELVEVIRRAARQFQKSAPPKDDLTLAVIKVSE